MKGTLDILHKSFAEKLLGKFGTRRSSRFPASASEKLEGYDEGKPEGLWTNHELVVGLMWLSNQTRTDITNAIRAVARYNHVPASVH